MASIKGIIVEIGGDTSGLQKALGKVNSSTASLSKELKGVNSLLKLDPKNTELVSQKQQILKENIEQTSKKLEELKKAQEMADETIASGGKISQENYRNLQREIINTQNKLNNLKAEVSNWTKAGRSIEEFGNKVTNISNKIDKMGTTLTTRLTLPIVGITTTAIASMDAVDEGLDVIATKTGATGLAAKELQQIYKEVASEVPGEFGDIGAAIGEINTRLDLTGDKLKTASIDFLKFAKVNGVDVNTSVQLVTRAMGDAGIEADKYSELLDMLTVAGQKSGISIESLTTNLAKYGAPMRALGIDTKNAIAMFAGWEKAGVNTEIAFSGMKKAISNWGAAGKDSTKEFAKTLEEIKKCPDIAKATTKAIEVFGAKAGPDLADAIKGGRFEFEQYIEALNNGTGTIENTYGQIVDEVDDTQLAMQNAKIAMHDAGEVAAKSLGPVLLDLSKQFKGLMERFDKLSDKEKKQILNMGLMVASIGPAVKILGIFNKGIGNTTKGAGTFSQAIGLMGKTSTDAFKNASIGTQNLAKTLTALTSPTGLATIGITALTAAMAAHIIKTQNEITSLGGLKKELDSQQESWKSLTDTRSESLANSLAEINYIEKLSEELKKMTDANGQVKEGYEARASYILNELNGALGTEYEMNGNIIKQYSELKDGIDAIITKKKAETYLNAYQEEYQTALKNSNEAMDSYVKLWEKYEEATKKYYSSSGVARVQASQEMATIQKELQEQSNMLNEYGQVIENYENLLSASASGSAETIEEAMKKMGQSYTDAKGDTETSLTDQIQKYESYKEQIKNITSEALQNNKQYLMDMITDNANSNQQRLDDTIKSLREQTSAVHGLTEDQKNAWKELARSDRDAYTETINGLDEDTKKAIEDATGIWVQDTSVEKAADSLGQKAETGFRTHVDGATWGMDLSSNIASGMISKKSELSVSNASSTVAGWIKKILGHSVPKAGPLKDELTYMPDMIENFAMGIDKNKSKLVTSIMNMTKEMQDELKLVQVQDFGKLQGNLSNQIVDSTKTIFTTPQIVFNVQELDEAKLQQCFNYINKKFGSTY